MIRRLRRASVIATLPLLAWAAMASAECAWVLWAGAERNPRPVVGDPMQWSPIDSFTVQRDCLATVELSSKDPKNRTWTFRCLPDTVDPRGPKGK
jgi:hypothetical protein